MLWAERQSMVCWWNYSEGAPWEQATKAHVLWQYGPHLQQWSCTCGGSNWHHTPPTNDWGLKTTLTSYQSSLLWSASRTCDMVIQREIFLALPRVDTAPQHVVNLRLASEESWDLESSTTGPGSGKPCDWIQTIQNNWFHMPTFVQSNTTKRVEEIQFCITRSQVGYNEYWWVLQPFSVQCAFRVHNPAKKEWKYDEPGTSTVQKANCLCKTAVNESSSNSSSSLWSIYRKTSGPLHTIMKHLVNLL